MQIEVRIKSYEASLLHHSCTVLENIIKIASLNIKHSQRLFKIQKIFFKPKKRKYTVLKSPHVHKKSREQFERGTWKSLFIIHISTTLHCETHNNNLYLDILSLKSIFASMFLKILKAQNINFLGVQMHVKTIDKKYAY